MPILDLAEYKTRAGVTGSARDTQITPAIAVAEDVVNRECGRVFDTAQTTEVRTFPYSGSGFIQTDDFTTLISASIGGALQPLSQCFPGPSTGPNDPFFFIRLLGRGASPQMGFMWNADVLAAEGKLGIGTAEIEAVWGWTEIPESVKQAVVWLTTEIAAEDPGAQDGRDVASESQGEVTYVYDRSGEDTTTKSTPELPPRIRQLLHPFVRTRF